MEKSWAHEVSRRSMFVITLGSHMRSSSIRQLPVKEEHSRCNACFCFGVFGDYESVSI